MTSKSILLYFKEKSVNTVSGDVNGVDSTVSNDVNIEPTVDLIQSEVSNSGITLSLSGSCETRELFFLKSPTIFPRVLSSKIK